MATERRSSLFWPLVLIAAGVLWILIRLGQVPATNLWALTVLWPVILIGAGVGLLARPYWRFAMPVANFLVVSVLFVGVLFAPRFAWNRAPESAITGIPFFSDSGERGSGKLVSERRAIKDVSAIHIAYPAQYVIRQGSTEAMTIAAEDNVAASIRTQVLKNVLEIDMVRPHNGYIAPTKPVIITITVKDLKDVRFDSAGELTIEGLKTPDLKVSLDGAGSLKLEDIELQSLDAILSGVGSMRANGTATEISVRVDGMGSFDGEGLRSEIATVTLDGLGSASVWADGKLTATVNGLGSVNYFGDATLTKSINGLGTVQHSGSK